MILCLHFVSLLGWVPEVACLLRGFGVGDGVRYFRLRYCTLWFGLMVCFVVYYLSCWGEFHGCPTALWVFRFDLDVAFEWFDFGFSVAGLVEVCGFVCFVAGVCFYV